MFYRIAGIVLLGALAAGCATNPSASELAKQQIAAEKMQAEARAQRRNDEQKQMERHVNAVPNWALDAPQPDATGMYAVGMAESKNLRLALRQATLDAEFGLAKLYNQELSGSERAYARDDGVAGVDEQYTALIDKLVDSVPLAGFQVVKQEVKPIDGMYHAFVLLKLPYDEFNRVLQRQKRDARDASITAAFDDLERRLESRRLQKREDRQLEHDLRLEEMKARQEALNAGQGSQLQDQPAGAVAER